MSTATLEKTTVDTGSDLASLVITYHYQHHGEWTDILPKDCQFDMCKVADECLKLDETFFGTGD